jgi:predicted glycogen debranching enzyme
MMPSPLPTLHLPHDPSNPTAGLAGREWLVTNGLGGYASGPVLGPPARRQHGWFVPSLAHPEGRFVLLPRLEDSVETARGPAPLGPDATAASLRSFRLQGTVPVWRFEVGGCVIERDLVMPHGRNAVCVRWRLVAGAACTLRLRPYIGGRRHDEPLGSAPPPRHGWPAASMGGGADAQPGALLALTLDRGIRLALQLQPASARFVAEPRTLHDQEFATELARGYDHREDQQSPGYWSISLAAGGEVCLYASTEDLPVPPPGVWFDAEAARQASLLQQSHVDHADAVATRLVLACDAFIVLPGSRRGEAGTRGDDDPDFRSVIAGYHWFNDWGRDTMISLEGLALLTGRHAEARAILRTFARYIRHGLLPNLFAEGGREALYHTVDATLWFFHALARHARHSGDHSLVDELFPVLQDVIDHHVRGTRHGIGMDTADGLLQAAQAGYQLTWMDAKMGDWVVTPRRGKPVEIQALWFNALRLMACWAARNGASGRDYAALADRAGRSFGQRFWCAAQGHLFDVVDGPEGDDASLRPNQVFALSLDHPVLAAERRPAVLDVVARELLTPLGLRTLGPGDPAYQPRYAGDLRSRDGAYHQGTVWPWLLGHWVDAWLRVHGPGPAARAWLQRLPAHLTETGVGHVGEVFDAEPPHHPGGCIAQAWSAAELLRAWHNTRNPAHG